jgi:hypothetical protein
MIGITMKIDFEWKDSRLLYKNLSEDDNEVGFR